MPSATKCFVSLILRFNLCCRVVEIFAHILHRYMLAEFTRPILRFFFLSKIQMSQLFAWQKREEF